MSKASLHAETKVEAIEKGREIGKNQGLEVMGVMYRKPLEKEEFKNMTEIQEMGRELRELLEQIREEFHSGRLNAHEGNGKVLWNQMVERAQSLHERAQPVHSAQMIENRGCQPDDPNFYHHLHAVEDLLETVGC